MKKLLGVLLVTLLVIPNLMFAGGQADGLTDIGGHWAEGALQLSYNAGLISGYGDGSYHPAQAIRMSELAVLINRFFGLTAVGGETFADISGSEWYAHHARIAAHNYLDSHAFNGSSVVGYTWAAEMLARVCGVDIVNLSWENRESQSAEVQAFLAFFDEAMIHAPHTLSRGGAVSILSELHARYGSERVEESPLMPAGTKVIMMDGVWTVAEDQSDPEAAIGIFAIEDLVGINYGDYDTEEVMSLYQDFVLMRSLDFNDPASYRNAAAPDGRDADRDMDLSETIMQALTDREGHGFPPIGIYARVTQTVDVMPALVNYDPMAEADYDYDRHLNGYKPNMSYLTRKKLYRGDFDGNNFTINNLFINADASYGSVGFFAIIKNGTVSNLNISNADVTGYQNGVGTLAGGNVGGTVDNCHVYNSKVQSAGNYYLDDVSGATVGGLLGLSTKIVRNSSAEADVTSVNGLEVGGLIGASGGASCEIPGRSVITVVENCSASGDVNGLSKVGGLVGNFVGDMNNCSYDGGTVTAGYGPAGGLVGMTKSTYTGFTTIKNSRAQDFTVSGDETVGSLGGFFGRAVKVAISDCYAVDGQVAGGQGLGGFGGWAGNPYTEELGVSIDRCYAVVSVNGEHYLGGFLGYAGLNTQVHDAYSLGDVTVTEAPAGMIPLAGGFIGHNDIGAQISQTYATGKVEAAAMFEVSIGGIAGRNDGLIGNSVALNPRLKGQGSVNQIAGTYCETAEFLSNYASAYISDGFQLMDPGTRYDERGGELYPYRFTDRYFLIYNQNWSVPDGGAGWDMNDIWQAMPGIGFPVLR